GSVDGAIRLAAVLHRARNGEPLVAGPLVHFCSTGREGGSPRASRGLGRHYRDPHETVGLVQRAGAVLFELLLVFPGDVAARLSRTRAPFPEVQDGSLR